MHNSMWGNKSTSAWRLHAARAALENSTQHLQEWQLSTSNRQTARDCSKILYRIISLQSCVTSGYRVEDNLSHQHCVAASNDPNWER